jgi:vitellogenic carboxypeptidase-like protein
MQKAIIIILLLSLIITTVYCDTVYLNDLPDGNEALVKSKTLAKLPNINSTVSYSGYVAMDSKYQSALFYWMFPARSNRSDAPVIVYMEGGPGFSSELQVFNGVGPFQIDNNGDVHENKNTWCTNYTIIYIDNPVGVGFSYSNDPALYSRDQAQVSQNLYKGLTTILQKYTSLKYNPVYIWGESYGGK